MTTRTRRMFNGTGDLVAEMLEGYVLAHQDVIALHDGMVVRARPKPAGRVGLVIGNGSGHEPAMIGWVGHGLLDVNVPGAVFSSPGPSRILDGIRAADRGAGVLLLVSSHAGDIMNASLAIADAEAEGLRARMVVLYDDIASAPPDRAEDRRGGPGLFFVWKIVGALAETAASLDECAEMAERVRGRVRSIAAAIGTVAHPVSGQPLGSTPENTLSVGLGVHGEAGSAIGNDASADDIAEDLVSRLVADTGIGAGAQVGLLVNNAGSLTIMELSILFRGAARALARRGISVARSWLGAYATTLDQAGFAFGLLELDDDLTDLYDAPARGAAFVSVGPGA